MLGNILGWLTAGGAILLLLDIFLSERTKTWLSRMVTIVWSYLDDLRALSLVGWLKNPRAKTWLAITIGLFLLTIETLQVGAAAFFEEGFTLHAIIVMLVAVGVAPIVLISFVALPSDKYYWLKVLAILVCAAGLFAIVAPSSFEYIGIISVVVVVPIVFISRPIFAGLLELSSGPYSLLKMCGVLLCLMLILLFVWFSFLAYVTSYSDTAIVLLMCFIALGLIVLCASLIFASIALAYIAAVVLYAGELVVRRIAEYPKGPLLALIAIFGALTGLLKVFAH
jgi:hypothetical protein